MYANLASPIQRQNVLQELNIRATSFEVARLHSRGAVCATNRCPKKSKLIHSLELWPSVQPRVLPYKVGATSQLSTGNARGKG
jgi:hypothetical protein